MEVPISSQGNVAPHKQSYFFEAIQSSIAKDKQFAQRLLKWGLNETLVISSFRFNQKYEAMESESFLKDLFSNPNVRYLVNLGYPSGSVSNIKYQDLRASETTVDIFDKLEENKIIKGQYIQKMMSKELQGIQIPDLLRDALIDEESDNFCIFSQKQRKQLLFRLFTLLVVGGSMNQYEDLITPYLQEVKKLYKSLVTVRKDAQTGDIFVDTNAYQIQRIDNFYQKGYNPQEVLYVIVNPTTRIVHIVYNKWVKFW